MKNIENREKKVMKYCEAEYLRRATNAMVKLKDGPCGKNKYHFEAKMKAFMIGIWYTSRMLLVSEFGKGFSQNKCQK